jgi:multiple sugar transport system permease protein
LLPETKTQPEDSQLNLDRRQQNRRIFHRWPVILGYSLLVLYSLFVALPLIIVIASSLRPIEDTFRHMMPFSWRTLVPTHLTFEAYFELFRKYAFGRAVFNSFFVSVMTVLGGVLVNSMAGFAFASFRFRGQEVLFAFVLLTFMVPFEAIAIPLYQFVNGLGLVNTYWSLILPGIANGLVVFLFRQFFRGLPVSLIEAARIEGASWLTIFFRLVLPLSKPAIISGSILMFIVQWTSFFYPLLVANKPAYRVIQVAMADFFTQYQTLWDLLFAAVVVAALVPIAIILPLQRYYVQGVTGTGINE